MQLRTSFDAWRIALLAVLGGVPLAVACSSDSDDDPPGQAGSAGSSNPAGQSGAAGSGGGGGTGGAAGSGGSAGGVVGPNAFVCRSPQLPSENKVDQGFILCEGGVYHRPEKRTCQLVRPAGETCTPPTGDTTSTCTRDDQCTEAPNGVCELQSGFEGGGRGGGCQCRYGCATDADCKSGQLCFCPTEKSAGTCMAAACTSDADCGGGLCATYQIEPSCGGKGFACQRPDETCLSNADCQEMSRGVCAYTDGKRVCELGGCAIGRPFLVEGEARVAPLAPRDDWSRSAPPGLEGLDAGLRRRLGDEWARAGQMEHASIAAFARFTLQLLSLGAPPGLVADAQRASLDELEHARLCFGLSGRFLGEAVGPGPLPVDGALEGMTLETATLTAVVEGCVGETLAALEAAESLAFATDGATRSVLEVIVADETRHAELAWRFVSWALARGGASLRAAVADAFAAAAAGAREGDGAAGEGDDDVALSFGVLSRPRKAALRRRALLEVVGPAAEALLAGASQKAVAARDGGVGLAALS